MIRYMYILWGDCHCKNLTILKCTIQLCLVVGQPSLLSSPKHVHHAKRKPCTTEESLTICPLPPTTSPGQPLVCFLFLWIWLYWMSHMTSFPQDYRFWEFVSWPWLTKCSQASTFWFLASSSSLASLRETCTTGSSQNRTTHWTYLDLLMPLG